MHKIQRNALIFHSMIERKTDGETNETAMNTSETVKLTEIVHNTRHAFISTSKQNIYLN